MYPIAPQHSDSGSYAVISAALSRQCTVLPARPMNTEQSRQSKPAGDSMIDRLLPQRR